MDSIQPTAINSTVAQPHRPPVNSQQANRNTSPDVLRPLLPGDRDRANIVRVKLRMLPSRARSEVRSQHNFKFDLGASTLDAPPPPWEAQRPTGIELPPRLPASVVDLCCRALDCRHVCTVVNGPSTSCSPLLFAWTSIFTFRLCLDTSANFYLNRSEFDFRLRFSFMFRHTLTAGREFCQTRKKTCFFPVFSTRA